MIGHGSDEARRTRYITPNDQNITFFSSYGPRDVRGTVKGNVYFIFIVTVDENTIEIVFEIVFEHIVRETVLRSFF